MLKIIFKNIKNKAGDGFTLIEALVSIALILIAVIGPLTLAMNAINTIIQNKNRVIASYLAEEVVENFKNYRDDFSLACSNIYLDTSTDDTTNITTINNAYCGEEGDLGMQVPTNFIGSNDISSTPNTNPRNISWKMFVASTFSSGNNFPDNTIPPKEYFIDDDSFVSNPKNLNIIDYGSSCVNLSFDQIYGYSCSKGSSTVFKRKTKITKISDNTLMIQVDVVYTNYGLFAAGQKSVSVVDYIYER